MVVAIPIKNKWAQRAGLGPELVVVALGMAALGVVG
jgi:hypothetical protein